MSRRILPLLFLSLMSAVISSFSDHSSIDSLSYHQGMDEDWVDSVLATMTVEEKIGQLFMVAAYSNKGAEHEEELNSLIDKYHIGGVIFFQGSPTRQAQLTNRLQSRPRIPLLVGMDAEWGLAMRLDSVQKYPYQMTLGALSDDSLVYQVGRDMAEQCRRLGVHMSFSPVLDINNNPANPVIGFRSFGENRNQVIRKGSALVQGLQSRRVLAVGKHFPGHGDTDVDSHHNLPVVDHDINRISAVEMYPFGMMARKGIAGIMTAHLFVPALDSIERPASLSPVVVEGKLRTYFKFDGLIVSDALNMGALDRYGEPGEVELMALEAGNDILLFPNDVPAAVAKIRAALDEGSLREEDLNAHCRRVLLAKKWAGLDDYQPTAEENLIEDLNDEKYEALQNEVRSEAITLLRNTFLPLSLNLDDRLAYIQIGGEQFDALHDEIQKYREVESAFLDKDATDFERGMVYEQLKGFNTVVVGIDGLNPFAGKNFGLTKEMIINVQELSRHFDRTAVVVLGSPYVINELELSEDIEALMVSYQNDELTQRMTAQALFGARAIKGRLPFQLEEYISGIGIDMPRRNILSYGAPGEKGIKRSDLERIDSVVATGLDKMAYPGCQVLVAKDGMVVYDKAFGYHTYEQTREVKTSDIYDVASITKIASTLAAVMRLDSEGRISLDDTIGQYLEDFRGTVYSDLQLREVLAHQAGLQAWIPFYTNTVEKGVPRYDVYSLDSNSTYPHRVAENLYIHKNYPDSMMAIIRATPLNKRGDYKYSDLGYYFLKAIVEQVQGESLDQLVQEDFYRPMGMSTTGYHPRYRFDLERVPPTEFDVYFRRQIVHGDVHDPGAAMLGGVGGHAGLFSSANDLAKLMYMYSHSGTYGDDIYLADSVLVEYIKCQFCDGTKEENRRAAGFDKPVRHGEGGPTCQCISLESFGHSGFTGTLAWADPEQDVIYIFLSNRVYPDAGNKKLITMGIRTDIMEVLYEALGR